MKRLLRAFPIERRFAWKRSAAAAALGLWLASAAAPSLARPIPGPAQPFFDEPVPTAEVAQRGSISLAQATAMAQRRYQGRVVRAETVMKGGRTVHEIRILGEDGRVRTVRIDAETGAFL